MWWQVSLAFSLVFFLLLERLGNAAGLLLLLLVSPGSVRVSAVKRFAGVQLLGSGFSFAVSVSSGVASAAVSALSGLMAYALFAAAIALVMTGLYVLNEVKPDVIVVAVEYWNTALAPVLHAVVVVPLGLLEVAVGALIPIWNALWFLLTRMGSELLVKAALTDVSPFVRLGKGVFGTVQESALSAARFAGSTTLCERESPLVCLDAGRRSLDLITPLSELRQVAEAATEILFSLCRSASGPLDIALYPLRDINFAKVRSRPFPALSRGFARPDTDCPFPS